MQKANFTSQCTYVINKLTIYSFIVCHFSKWIIPNFIIFLLSKETLTITGFKPRFRKRLFYQLCYFVLPKINLKYNCLKQVLLTPRNCWDGGLGNKNALTVVCIGFKWVKQLESIKMQIHFGYRCSCKLTLWGKKRPLLFIWPLSCT